MMRLIEWFAGNRVAATLLTVSVIVGGITALSGQKVEVFPEFAIDLVRVTVAYPGASPAEVEESILVRIEEKVHDLDGIKRILSSAGEGVGTVSIQLESGADARKLLDEVKARVDAIDTFPEAAEEPVIEEPVHRAQVIDVAVSGAIGERELKRAGEMVRDEIAALPGISQVELVGARPDEITIEVSEASLRRHGLSFDQVAAAVRRSSLDLPAGNLRTVAGDVLLRTRAQAYRGDEFAAIPVATRADGSSLAIGDIAAVRDGFAEVDIASRFDGRPAVLVQVFRVGDQNALDLAAAVRDYVAGAQARMPAGVSLTVWNDTSLFLSGRISLLLTNAAQGFFLVFLVLALFLRFKLAWWVSIGIPVSFLGALCFLPLLDVSINMISLFAFILVLGIVVDDAIVVGENIHHHRSLGLGPAEAARRGVREVALPVAVAVMTAVISFLPMMNVPGFMGNIWRVIPVVCIATLLFSLVETQLALPSHLAHEGGLLERIGTWLTRPLRPLLPLWTGLQGACARGLDGFVARVYMPLLDRCLAWRYATFAVFVAAMILTIGLIAGGRLRFTYFPSVEGDIIAADVVLPPGATAAQTAEAVGRLEAAAIRLRAELAASAGEPVVDHLLASVGTQPYRGMVGGPGAGATSGSGVGEVMLALVPSERRSMPTHEVQRRWRELVGDLPGVSELTYSADIASAGNAIEVRFAGDDLVALGDIAEDLRAELATFAGVYNITDDHRQGKDELVLRLSPSAETLGIGQLDLARQLRQAFYGEEAQRVQRGRDDIKVMVRYPEAERATVGDLDGFRVRAADGRELPLRSVAEVEAGAGYARISRSDRKRTVTVSASLDPAVANGNEINARLAATTLPAVLRDHPGTTWSMEGEAREQRESMSGLANGYLLSLLVIYVMIAVSFSSFVQPLIIMGAIPFGIVGAALGHLVMGLDLSILSICGIVALAGIEVNDSIVLVEFINRARAAGMPIQQALREAGPRRFRPIFLTSATTFIGLLPVIVSGQLSVQAKFLVPMAVSLGFGGVFSTAITLLLVPCAYAVIEDLKGHRPEVRKSGSPEVS